MEKIKESSYPSELIPLAKSISCNFIDARTTAKDYLKTVVGNNSFDKRQILSNQFILSTCLRYEIYDFSNQQKHEVPFLYVSGATCIRRLLAVLVGLQSEIIGEREILMQVARSVKDSFDAGCINDTIFNDLQKLIFVSEQIRQNCAVNSNENYSTIAADIFVDHLSGRHDITIAIVGGGYMADKFFSSLLKTNSLKIKKILWINRGTSQLKDRVAEFVHLLNYDIEVLDLETGRVALKEADAIFCALSKSPYFYNSEDYKNGSFVVDVSYPQVFSEKKDVSIVTISNTDFYSLVRETVSKSNIALANNAIDDVINFLGDNI